MLEAGFGLRVFPFELARVISSALCTCESVSPGRRRAMPPALRPADRRRHAEGKPHFDIGIGKFEFRGHYADDGVGLIGDGNRAADRRGVGMEAPAPEAVAEHGFMIAVAEGAAEFRTGAEHGEQAGRGAARDDLVGLAGAINGHVVAQVPAGFFEEVGAVLQAR